MKQARETRILIAGNWHYNDKMQKLIAAKINSCEN